MSAQTATRSADSVTHLLGQWLLPACGADPVDLGNGFFSCGTGDVAAIDCSACLEWVHA
jgi:hypothetical protein